MTTAWLFLNLTLLGPFLLLGAEAAQAQTTESHPDPSWLSRTAAQRMGSDWRTVIGPLPFPGSCAAHSLFPPTRLAFIIRVDPSPLPAVFFPISLLRSFSFFFTSP